MDLRDFVAFCLLTLSLAVLPALSSPESHEQTNFIGHVDTNRARQFDEHSLSNQPPSSATVGAARRPKLEKLPRTTVPSHNTISAKMLRKNQVYEP